MYKLELAYLDLSCIVHKFKTLGELSAAYKKAWCDPNVTRMMVL